MTLQSGGSTRPGSPRMVAARQRQAQAVQLRIAGATLEAIAAKLGYGTPAAAHNAIQAALNRTVQLPAAELRELELRRLDALLMALWPNATKGGLETIDRVLRISDRRVRLLGLDAPIKIDLGAELRKAAEAEGLDPEEMVRIAAALTTAVM